MRILFLESDKDLRGFFGSKLRDEFKGTIDLVATWEKAIKHLKTERPYDFIIADYCSPDSSGFELMKFHERHSIEGRFVFYTNNPYLDVQLLSSSSSVVQKYSYEELRQFLVNNIKHEAI